MRIIRYLLAAPFLLLCFSTTNANTGYPYSSVCPYPAGGRYQLPTDADQWSFYKCECTSYVAYRVNQLLDAIPATSTFTNHYLGPHWSDAHTWNNAAALSNVPVTTNPLDGSIAYWEAYSPSAGEHGHVAFVETVDYSNNEIRVSEYNAAGNAHRYGERTLKPSDAAYPDGFIHVPFAAYYSLSMCLTNTNPFFVYQCFFNPDSNNRIAYLNDVGYGIGGLGGGGSLPDFVWLDAWIEDLSTGNVITSTVLPNQQLKARCRHINDGADSPVDIEVKALLSNGESVDNNPTTVATDNIQKSNLDHDEKHIESFVFSAPSENGIYNVTCDTDTDDDVVEEHESNNEYNDGYVFEVDDLAWMDTIIQYYLND